MSLKINYYGSWCVKIVDKIGRKNRYNIILLLLNHDKIIQYNSIGLHIRAQTS